MPQNGKNVYEKCSGIGMVEYMSWFAQHFEGRSVTNDVTKFFWHFDRCVENYVKSYNFISVV